MLTLNDGRSELWQWDTGRKLTVDADCTQVHFSNKFFGRSVDVDVFDGTAEIPDVLLQVDKELLVWAFVGTPENGYTKISKVFKVNKRNKPADYVFTPPEQTTLEEIKEKLDYLESIQDPDAIKNAVDEYLANNPIQVEEKDPTVPDWAKQPTKPKYTANEVGAVATVNGTAPDENGNVEITIPDSGGNTDLTGYATEQWVKDQKYLTAVPEGYAKTEDIPKKPGDIGADPKGTAASAVSQHNTSEDSHQDIRLELQAINARLTAFFNSDDQTLDELSEIVAYITNNKTLIQGITTSKVSVTDIINNLVTNVANKPLSAAQGVVLNGLISALSYRLENYQPKGDYALKSELPSVPTKVSQLQNDAGYLTEHQDLTGYATERYVQGYAQPKGNYLTEVPEGYAKTEDIPTKPSDIGAQPEGDYALRSEIPSVPVKSVNGKTGAVSLTATDVKARPDSWMPTASDVGAMPNTTKIPAKTSDLTNDSGFITGYTETDPTVPAWAKNATKPSYSKSEVGLGNVDNVKQYSASNPPPYPVTSVNGKTGAVTVSVPTKVSQLQNDSGFLTEISKEEIVQQVIAALGTPVFGRVDGENNIILTGELVDGTYTIKYEDADGNVTEIGTLNNNPVPTYTNLFVAETCQLNKRTNSSGNVSDNAGGFLTDYIDLGDAMASGGTNVLHYKNMYFHTTNWVNGSYEVYSFICYYDSSKKFLKTAGQREIADVLSADGDYTKTLDATLTSARFIRVTALILPNPGATTQITTLTSKDQLANCKLALNETITD